VLAAELAFLVGGGVFFWAFVVWLVPMVVVVNRDGVMKRPRHRRSQQ
jgi:hypothetical protein